MPIPMHPNGQSRIPWFVRGDLDGFFGLAVDNLIQFLLILGLCVSTCGLETAFVLSRVLPGAAISLVLGNLFYAWQARRLGRVERRADVTALPFGINTVSLLAFVFFVMAPTYQDWAGRPGISNTEAARIAWQVGLVACLMSGVLEMAGSLVAGWIRKATPRAALLSTLAGIAVGFISMEFVLRTFDRPLVAFLPLGILLVRYLGNANLPGGLPAGLVAILTGTAAAWMLRFANLPGAPELGGDLLGTLGFYPPVFSMASIGSAFTSPDVWGRISIILPMGLINVLGALQSLESAEAEGDAFPTRPSLAVNGLSSVVAACFGSCFPTTIYIGHPGWKRMGARSGYSVLNAIFFTLVALTGIMGSIARVVPIEAGMAILVWIAVIIVSQAFTATPRRHAPAVVIGLLPALAAWGWQLVEMTQQGLKFSGRLAQEATLPLLVRDLTHTTLPYLNGLLSLKAGFMFSAMFLSAMVVFLIEGNLKRAAVWSGMASLFSILGMMHSYSLTALAVREEIRPGFAWEAALGYLALAILFLSMAGRARPWNEPQGENSETPSG